MMKKLIPGYENLSGQEGSGAEGVGANQGLMPYMAHWLPRAHVSSNAALLCRG